MSLAPKRTSSVLLMAPTISQALPLSSAVFPPSGGPVRSFRQEAPETSVSLASEELLWTLTHGLAASPEPQAQAQQIRERSGCGCGCEGGRSGGRPSGRTADSGRNFLRPL